MPRLRYSPARSRVRLFLRQLLVFVPPAVSAVCFAVVAKTMSVRAVRVRGVRLCRPVVTPGPREPAAVSLQLATSRGFLLCELVQSRLDLVLAFGVWNVLGLLLRVPWVYRFYPFKVFCSENKKRKEVGWLLCHLLTSCRYPDTKEFLKGPQAF